VAPDAAESGSSGASERKRSGRSQKAGSRVDQYIGVIADQLARPRLTLPPSRAPTERPTTPTLGIARRACPLHPPRDESARNVVMRLAVKQTTGPEGPTVRAALTL